MPAGNKAPYSEITSIRQASMDKALVRLVAQSAQSLASDTDVALTFGASSEDYDTAGWHDVGTNTSRITPNIAGYIRLSGTVWLGADTDDISFYASIGKNGTVVQRNRLVLPSTATASAFRSYAVTCVLTANGTTDYFELFGRQLQAAAGSLNTNVAAGGFSSTFEAEYLRPL
jgi:hypothetical protein